VQALAALDAKLANTPVPAAAPNALSLSALEQRSAAYDRVMGIVEFAAEKIVGAGPETIKAEREQFFFEHVTLPVLIDMRQTTAAIRLQKALAASDPAAVRRWSMLAFDGLRALEDEINPRGASPVRELVPEVVDPRRQQSLQRAPFISAHALVSHRALSDTLTPAFRLKAEATCFVSSG